MKKIILLGLVVLFCNDITSQVQGITVGGNLVGDNSFSNDITRKRFSFDASIMAEYDFDNDIFLSINFGITRKGYRLLTDTGEDSLLFNPIYFQLPVMYNQYVAHDVIAFGGIEINTFFGGMAHEPNGNSHELFKHSRFFEITGVAGVKYYIDDWLTRIIHGFSL